MNLSTCTTLIALMDAIEAHDPKASLLAKARLTRLLIEATLARANEYAAKNEPR